MAKKDSPDAAYLRELVAATRLQHGPAMVPEPETEEADDADGSAAPARPDEIPRAERTDLVDDEIVEWCAHRDHSDADNGKRLIAHFGIDLTVMRQAKSRAPAYGVWNGTNWDIETGNTAALALAQLLGDRIAEEADHLMMTDAEMKVIYKAREAREKEEAERTPEDTRRIQLAEKIEQRFMDRCASRIKFGVSSKNLGKLKAMLECAAPLLMRGPDEFDANHYKVAVKGHTLTFRNGPEKIVNPDLERDDAPEDAPDTITVKMAKVKVRAGHSREDYITSTIPTAHKAAATCPLWLAFLEEFMPDPAKRKLLQVAFGLGLLGITVQKLFFHYGHGANGKSVALEVICRVLGGNAVTLPAESFTGGAGQSGQASPDLARLYGRRFLRVTELPEGDPLREDLVKRLTGGEAIPVRDLFSGYFDFLPIFTAHMSGNGYPKITGTDNGIWRRMTVIRWPITIADGRQRNFEEVVGEFAPEHSGILNWLIEGALIYLREGLVIPDDVVQETQKYRAEMDYSSAFVNRCVVVDPASFVRARELYDAYVAWALDSAVKPISGVKFGSIMGKKFERVDDMHGRRYVGIRLENVPVRPTRTAEPEDADDYPEGYGGPDEAQG
ncbi:DNA primase family protein [Aureimonas ureilytica]|uniref:DNA primase family protein n=1 Tax=Aureimonas ureilytica TaxID=401562 RepID=UPI0003AA70CD|nr:DNA primase family protein [Aureimonas ureilytica]